MTITHTVQILPKDTIQLGLQHEIGFVTHFYHQEWIFTIIKKFYQNYTLFIHHFHSIIWKQGWQGILGQSTQFGFFNLTNVLGMGWVMVGWGKSCEWVEMVLSLCLRLRLAIMTIFGGYETKNITSPSNINIFWIFTPNFRLFKVPSSHLVASRETSIGSEEGPLTGLQRSVGDIFVNW